MKEIPLTQGYTAFVDDEDFEELAIHKWSAYRDGHTVYATRNLYYSDGRHTTEKMHRLVLARKLGRPIIRGMYSDHVNGNGLDNRRDNLREVTCAQNQRNCRQHANNSRSRFLGVSLQKNCGKWLSYIRVDKKLVRLGYYTSELEAAQAREAYIEAHPDLNARSNVWREGTP